MDKINFYLDASTRENTQKSYARAIKHFEVEWQGLLPATADQIVQYVAHYADVLSVNTLRQRVVALSQWHIEQGFPDPTKTPILKKLFKGIQSVHQTQEKQAKALHINDLAIVVKNLEHKIDLAQKQGNFLDELRHTRNKSLLLLGFWRGFRGDELTRLLVEHIEHIPQQGLICYLARTKSDRALKGQSFKVPSLPQLCPVVAYQHWLQLSQLNQGPVYRAINRWGKLSEHALNIDSLRPLLQDVFKAAGLPDAEQYTTHSLRRGFANWANQQGWDTKTLMNYVGWKNIASATRYIDGQTFDFSSLEQQTFQIDSHALMVPNASS